jgi:hypothetical protein
MKKVITFLKNEYKYLKESAQGIRAYEVTIF